MRKTLIVFGLSAGLSSCMQEQSWWPKKHHTKMSKHDHKHSKQHSEEEKLPGHHHTE